MAISRGFLRLAEAEWQMQQWQVSDSLYQGHLSLVCGNLWLRQEKYLRAQRLAEAWPLEMGERAPNASVIVRAKEQGLVR